MLYECNYCKKKGAPLPGDRDTYCKHCGGTLKAITESEANTGPWPEEPDKIVCSQCTKQIHSSNYSKKLDMYICMSCRDDLVIALEHSCGALEPRTKTQDLTMPGQCSQCGKQKTSLFPVDDSMYFICENCHDKKTGNKGGLKFDQDKLRVDLISVVAEEGTAAVLTIGAKKYNDRNWEVGLDYNRVYRAARHHLMKWWRGEDFDKDSKLHHLDHCACNIMFLQQFVKDPDRYKEFDNRPNTEKSDGS